jgi:4-hydroxy-2-oxoheptanedioate aldolase
MAPTDGTIAASSARLRARWAQDEPAFGIWSITANPFLAELLGASPFDSVVVDLQHGAGTDADLLGLTQAMRSAGRAPLVRVPWNEPAAIMRALDVGAHGVIVPMVGSAEEAARAAAACRFPPHGQRSWGPLWGDVRADGAPPPQEQDDAVLCLVMVETQAGVDALEEIVTVPGVDGVFVGPNDLALGCGHGRATYRDSAEVDALLQHVVRTCRDADVVAGLYCSDVPMALHWAEQGARLLTAGVDTALLRTALATTWEQLARST